MNIQSNRVSTASSRRSRKTSATVLCALAFAIAGCAHRRAPDSTANDSHKQQSGAAKAASVIDPDSAKLVFKTRGMPMIVYFSMSTAAQACQGFEQVGNVFDSGRGTLLPWIANLTEKANRGINRAEVSRERQVKAGSPVQIRGYSKWTNSSANALQTVTWSQSCGPLVTTFTPDASKTYLVEFVFSGTSNCQQVVSDITDPNNPTPVSDQSTGSCLPD